MSALQASLLLRPLPSPLPPRRRQPLPSAFASLPRGANAPRRAPLRLRALDPIAPQPDASEPPAAASSSAAEAEESESTTMTESTAQPATMSGKEELEDLVGKARAWAVAVAAAVVAAVRRFVDWVLSRNWMSWWPFWRSDHRLQGLIEEADANPNDAAKQSALLHELNKFSPEELQELKQRVSGNEDKPFMNPGISEKQPLHVVMVDPKSTGRSTRFAQEIVSTMLFTIAVGVMCPVHVLQLAWVRGRKTNTYSNDNSMVLQNVKTFKDVKGCDDAKKELEEVVEYLKNPSKFTRLGGKLPKGILLTGAPGTGKTLLAKAIAGEAGVPFFYRAGSEFEEMFVGVGARRVRSLFQAAKKKAPCIVFIDEIDAVGSTRKQWEGHTKKTLHQLLVEMDGFEQNEGIIVMAATNLADILDPALTRPGRFDRHIVVPSPDVRGRQEILELYLQDKPVANDVDINAIARSTPGFNGADLANLVNIAAIKAALTAYHESGHAIVALNTQGAHPIHKATILPRGSALGMVTQLPSQDETSISKKQLLARLDVCMGGRVAEELIFGEDNVTTGARNDLHTATELAQYMVSNCGMSDAIGPVHVKERPSVEMQSRIDAEVVKLLREAYGRVKRLLKKHEKQLHALANALLERETLTADEINKVVHPYQEEPQFSFQDEEFALT
ncbi:ATP-dependent zinc metalloprotease FTSH 11 chloroplastic/mitochondrial [Zea mays]|uniref:ATP-dependent zinc metalloprotease FTSH 11 chloroplastic/mitochondrial n=1 Tax=Zea mays TaxID=4577 RepID=A0A1D6NJI3_MAIZE|nr:ATP-dependent zinc metalloprotease FTSH 11 chloroplastic/mitochondrial [Zea mays]ONM40426.1 ATP-dependent zinc metalloprotease FTSH 11 chloroplastic/mitochondrial [Zea mays]